MALFSPITTHEPDSVTLNQDSVTFVMEIGIVSPATNSTFMDLAGKLEPKW